MKGVIPNGGSVFGHDNRVRHPKPRIVAKYSTKLELHLILDRRTNSYQNGEGSEVKGRCNQEALPARRHRQDHKEKQPNGEYCCGNPDTCHKVCALPSLLTRNRLPIENCKHCSFCSLSRLTNSPDYTCCLRFGKYLY